MKNFFGLFLQTLGVIFVLLIVGAVIFFVVDPLGLRQMFSGAISGSRSGTSGAGTDKNPMLSPTQEKALETFGINPASVPSSFTPEQEACFTEKLGAERVAEIKGGSAPTAAEYFKAKGCL